MKGQKTIKFTLICFGFALLMFNSQNANAGTMVTYYPGSYMKMGDSDNYLISLIHGSSLANEGIVEEQDKEPWYHYRGSFVTSREGANTTVWIEAPLERHTTAAMDVNVSVLVEDADDTKQVQCTLIEVGYNTRVYDSDSDQSMNGQGTDTLEMQIDVTQSDTRLVLYCSLPGDA